MLADRDRIFTNLYGFQPWNLEAARTRGDWVDTAALMAGGPDAGSRVPHQPSDARNVLVSASPVSRSRRLFAKPTLT